MKKYILSFFIILFPFAGFCQNPTPASTQVKRILYINGTAHIGNGEVINKSAIGFADGKLTLVADITLIRIDRTAYDTIIDVDGKHIYPGLIALNTYIGLSEIEAVRSTNDFNETGSVNPSVRSIIAYNTDSKVIPTVRSNGILMAQIVPKGGLLSGQSSVVVLDAWNYEDAAYSTDGGLHINWPSMRINRSSNPEEENKQKKKIEHSLFELRKLFVDAKAYAATSAEIKNIHLESMRGLFNNSKKLFVHCNYVKDIIAATDLCTELGMHMVLVGGTDAWMVTDLLKQHNIPVVLIQSHRLPSREDEDVDMPFKLAALLKKEKVSFALSVPEFWQVRNLPFQAGTLAGHGLSKEEALESITLSPAKILSIDKTAGTLEPGKDATFIITSGDLLDMKSSAVEIAHIQGRQISLDNIQKQLNRKYRKKYGLN